MLSADSLPPYIIEEFMEERPGSSTKKEAGKEEPKKGGAETYRNNNGKVAPVFHFPR
jgi:hypothetical protein